MMFKQLNTYVPPKIYHAKITAGSTTPTILFNSTGSTATVTKNTGVYTFTFGSAILGTNTSVIVSSNDTDLSGTQGGGVSFSGYKNSTTVAKVEAANQIGSGGVPNDSANFEIIITIY
jgi:hypothetical protein